MLEFGIADEIIPEPTGGAHRDPAGTIARVLKSIGSALDDLASSSAAQLKEARYQKYRQIGAWQSERLETVKTGP